MSRNFQSMFFMNGTIQYVRQHRNPLPRDLHTVFYKKIQEKQVKNAVYLNVITDLIETYVRKLNVVTTDTDEQIIIRGKIQLLMDIDRDVRDAFFKKDAEFLTALSLVLNYQPNL